MVLRYIETCKFVSKGDFLDFVEADSVLIAVPRVFNSTI